MGLAAATLAGFAFVTPGLPTADVHLDDGGVWVTNGGQLLVGRLNKQIGELDASLTSAGKDVDVAQEGSDVLSLQPATGTLQQVDVAYVRLGTDVHVPVGAEVRLGGGRVAVLDPANGEVWLRASAQLGGLDVASQQPDLRLGAGADVAVGPTGVVAAVSVTAHRLTVLDPAHGTSSTALPADVRHPTVTVVGDRAAVLDAATGQLVTPDGAEHPLGAGASNAVLQQPGPAADGVLVATDTALLDVPLDGGAPRTIASGAGAPIAPVRAGGCVHAAWTAKPTYLQACTGRAQFSAAIPGAAPGAALTFRVNRSAVVLNGLQSGDVWLLDRAMTVARNWDEVRPPDPQNATNQQSDQFDSQQSLDRSAQNHPPVARDDAFGARPGLPALLPVLDNDTDPDGDVLVVSAVDAPAAAQGSVQVVDDGRRLQFTAAPGATGTVTFGYTIDDGRGGTASARVAVAIHPLTQNAPPVQVRATQTVVVQGGTVTQRVLTDWIDPDGDEMTLAGASVATGNTVRFTADGTVTYIDSGTAPGQRDVALDVSDGRAVGHGTLAVQVRPPGELPPTARPDHVTAFVGQTVTVSPLQNDTDPNQDTLRLSKVDAPGSVTVVPDYVGGTFTFTSPAPGTFYLQYTVVDGPDSAQALVRVDVLPTGTNHPPVAVRDLAFVPKAGSTTVDVLANDIDVDGDVLVVTGVSVAAQSGLSVSVRDHRFLTIAAPGLLPDAVTVTYTVSDGTASAQGSVVVRSIPPSTTDQPPVARPDTGTVRAGDVLSLDVLANDSDPDGDPLTLLPQLPEPPSGGTVSVVGGKLHVLAPAQPGTLRIVYAVADPAGQKASSLVTVYVRAADGQNSPPVPRDLTARVFAGTSTRIDVPLDGIDPDGDSVRVVGIDSAPTKGRITAVGTDHLQYEAFAATGTDSFTYTVEDRLGARATATVRVGIAARAPGNQPPVAQDDTATTRPGRVVSVDVLANDSDPDGDPISFTAHPFAAGGAAQPRLDGNRVRVVAPQSGAVTVPYTITDGRGGTATGYLTVTADPTAPLQPPVAVDDLVPADQLSPGGSVPVDVLANDSDPDGSPADLKVSLHVGADVATVTPDGHVVVHGTAAAQAIPYTITDVDGLTSTALVLVPAAANLPPRFKPGKAAATVGGSGATWSVADLVEDPEGHAVRLTGTHLSATNSDGSALASDATTLHFTPAARYSGPASLSFEVTDGTGPDDPKGRTALLTLALTVDRPDVNEPPVFAGASLKVSAGEGPASLALAPLVKDPDGGAPTFALPAARPAGLDVTLQGGTLTVSAAATTAVGTIARLDLTVSDGHNPPQPAPVDVTVAGSSRPLARAVADSAEADQGKATTVDVLANDVDPFPDTPLKVTAAQVLSGTGDASTDGSRVTVRPGGSFVGAVTVQYTVRDKTGDPARDVTGLLTVTVRGVPAQPVAPTVMEVRDATVVLSWPAPAANGAPIQDYRLRAAGVDQTCPTTTCTVSGLTNGTTYSFTVTARNAVGESPASPASGPARPDNQPDPPAAPTLTFGDGSLKVDWAAPHNTGSAITRYELELSPGASATATGTSYTFSGLTNGQSYQVRVRAYNGAPSPSDWSPYSAPETPAGVPAQPAAPTAAVSGGPIGGQVDVSWKAPATNGAAIDSYTLKVVHNGAVERSLTYPGGTTSATVSATNANQYSFSVSATNKAGPSPDSPQSAALTVYGKPATIAAVTAKEGDRQATLTFATPSDSGQAIKRYEAQWSGGSTTISGPGAVITGLTNNTPYSFQVRACNDYCADWSPSSNPVTPYGQPGSPSVTVTNSFKSVTFSWSAPASNGRTITGAEVSVDGGTFDPAPASGSTTAGSGYGESHSIQVREVDSAGQRSATVLRSGNTSTPTVTVGRAGNARYATLPPPHTECTDPSCQWITVSVSGMAPGTYTVFLWNDAPGAGLDNSSIAVDGAGNGYVQTGDYFGYPGYHIRATVDGVASNTLAW